MEMELPVEIVMDIFGVMFDGPVDTAEKRDAFYALSLVSKEVRDSVVKKLTECIEKIVIARPADLVNRDITVLMHVDQMWHNCGNDECGYAEYRFFHTDYSYDDMYFRYNHLMSVSDCGEVVTCDCGYGRFQEDDETDAMTISSMITEYHGDIDGLDESSYVVGDYGSMYRTAGREIRKWGVQVPF